MGVPKARGCFQKSQTIPSNRHGAEWRNKGLIPLSIGGESGDGIPEKSLCILVLGVKRCLNELVPPN